MSKVAKLENQEDVGSTLQEIPSEENLKRKPADDGEAPPNHVLLFSVGNPFYPINVNVIYSICKDFGNILRIVIFRKNGVQAMVELESVEVAEAIKASLHNKEIYANCCRLKIEFARQTKLNVTKNTADTWDPTLTDGVIKTETKHPLQPDAPSAAGYPNVQPNLAEYAAAYAPANLNIANAFPGMATTSATNPAADNAPLYSTDVAFQIRAKKLAALRQPQLCMQPCPVYPQPMQADMTAYPDVIGTNAVAVGYNPVNYYDPSAGMENFEEYGDLGCVVMAYNLNVEKINPTGVFNLFCMYGNVWVVKFLKTKVGCAMIQMGDREGAERSIRYLNGVPLFDDLLQLAISKQPFLGELGRGFELPNGSYSWKDFSSSKNNRFLNPTMAARNRLNPPSKVLHFFNTPPDLTEERLEDFIYTTSQIRVVDEMVFPRKPDRSASGLIEVETIADAIACVVRCNNVPLYAVHGGPPFFVKLCFSNVSSIAVAAREIEKKSAKALNNDSAQK
ncbi:RRM [Nesidiocoris tenuis]|uniref:RRM n=1 Tax=Nesidiocoris tenuis TaxID=355587 RepID=A0ABN7B3I4_9HEMI|nr:RRM [Nesidiocoris tenuis]